MGAGASGGVPFHHREWTQLLGNALEVGIVLVLSGRYHKDTHTHNHAVICATLRV